MAAIAAGGLAGCSGGASPDPDDTGGTGATATPTTVATSTPRPYEGPPYGRWVPDPSTLGRERVPFSAVDLASMTVQGDTLPRGLRESPHVDGWQPVSVNWQDVTLSLWFRGNFVIVGDYDAGAVVDGVAETEGWRDVGDHAGYALLATEDRRRAVAVSDRAIVIGRSPGDGMTGVEAATTVIDTGRGFVPRLAVASDAVAALVATVGDGSIVQWQPRDPPATPAPSAGQFAGLVGLGRWGRVVDADTTHVKLVFVFADAAAAERADLRAFVEANREDGPLAAWTDLHVSSERRVGIVAGTITRE